MHDRILAGQIIFVSMLITLSVLRIVLSKPLERTRWFKDNAFRLSLWTSAWGITVLVIGYVFDIRHQCVNLFATGPIFVILIALFILALIEVPAAWYNEIIKIVKFFRKR